MFSFNDQSLLQDPTHLPESSSMMCAGPWYEQISEQHFFNNASWSTTIVHNTHLLMQKTHQNDKSSSRRENSQRVRDSNAVYWKRQRKLLYFPLHWKNTTTVKRSCSRFIISINKLGHLFLYFIFSNSFAGKIEGKTKLEFVFQLYSNCTQFWQCILRCYRTMISF